MKKFLYLLFAVVVSLAMGACASVEKSAKQRQVASVLAYLFPGASEVPAASDKVSELKVPFRIGVAFVPDQSDSQFRLPETERIKLATKVQEAFSDYPFVKDIVAVPSVYLEPGGGFTNLERLAALLDLDVIALLSFDQVQNAGATGWSFLYWTGVGAYLIEGDQYDVLTAVDASVFHVKSHRLLLRAAGISQIKGGGTMVNFSEVAREARTRGFDDAMRDMLDKLQAEVKVFREQAPKNPNIRLMLPRGYDANVSRKASK